MNRRVVLRQAVKLSYSAPLIAATFHLTQRYASACSPHQECGPCETCSDVEGCIPIPGCVPE
jgi:hypothetical protein